jgi:hypothetical protein
MMYTLKPLMKMSGFFIGKFCIVRRPTLGLEIRGLLYLGELITSRPNAPSAIAL